MEGITDLGLGLLAAGIGAGFVTFGAGFGISRIASSACESIARQPEAGGEIRLSMIISAALIEGIALLGGVVCLILALK